MVDRKASAGLFIGVDVGTASVRTAVVNNTGTIVRTASRPIRIWQSEGGIYEQSSENIWTECRAAMNVRQKKKMIQFIYKSYKYKVLYNCKTLRNRQSNRCLKKSIYFNLVIYLKLLLL